MSLQVIDRYRPHLRRAAQTKIDTGQLKKVDELELLVAEQLQPLARLSLLMLLVALVCFVTLDLAAYFWSTSPAPISITWWSVLLWLILSILGYVVILPIHEVIHAIAFAFWGGRPYFGTKLPLALYCGAKEQLFYRNAYLVIGLAPLVVITFVGILLILYAPVVSIYLLFALIGNFAGAAGDVWVVWRLLRLPVSVLVEDTEAGYRAWELLSI